ncbi:hypothetical protein [Bosea sp. (in: a-proteobacteria)]|uniref:hypothetical protein n=1 Tax=Bosea sp. (in: a-proteobacteria) TaxID=1871050 RepID=UPI00333FD08E
MARATKRTDWRQSAIALLATYVLVLQTTLTALASGLAAQPDPFLAHPLCAPGQTTPANPVQQGGKTGLPACCAALCLSLATVLPPPGEPVIAARPTPRFAAVAHARSDKAVPAASRAYPLGARAPPFPA